MTVAIAVTLALCGIGWIYVASERERMCAVYGNRRHFLKTASPGFAAVLAGTGMLIWRFAT